MEEKISLEKVKCCKCGIEFNTPLKKGIDEEHTCKECQDDLCEDKSCDI